MKLFQVLYDQILLADEYELRPHLKQLGQSFVHEMERNNYRDIEWYSWPQSFSSTTGPWGGIGGQMITTMQMTVAILAYRQVVVWCEKTPFAFGKDTMELREAIAKNNLDSRHLAKYELVKFGPGE